MCYVNYVLFNVHTMINTVQEISPVQGILLMQKVELLILMLYILMRQFLEIILT